VSYGWAGNNLEIDLSQGKIERKQNDHKLYETFLGGKGIGAKLLWDRVPPGVDPFSPDNLLIFATGVLTGTLAPTASHGCVSFRSPQIKFNSYSIMGGFWAAELKHAGYDTIVISGKSSTPVYLWINDDKVEIRDASHLWGKDTYETGRIVREELRNDKAQVICIGPAGENRVSMASIEHPITGNSASQTGPGAVMGDKNLKAIVIYGTRDISIAQPAKFIELCDQILNRSDRMKKGFEPERWIKPLKYAWDSGFFGNVDEMPVGLGFENYDKLSIDFMKKTFLRERGCFNCPAGCQAWLSLPDGVYYHLMCESFVFSFSCKIPDVSFAVKCCNLCIRYGLDIVVTARIIGFSIDLFQRGILTKEDTGGMHLEFGNEEIAFALIEKIARREGLGDILAKGTYEAARIIGRGAEKHVHLVKKQDLQAEWYRLCPTSSLTLATSDRGDGHAVTVAATVGYTLGDMSRIPKRDTYIERGWWLYPKEWAKYLDVDHSVDYEGSANLAYYGENVKALCDVTGLCWWWAGFLVHTAIKLDMIIDLISAATGMDIDEAEAFKRVGRIRTLMRASDTRLGMRRRDDALPELFYQEPSPALKQRGVMKLDHDKFDKQLDKYYEMRGWNSDGIPTKGSLDQLDLDYVRQDLEDRAIL